MNKNEALRILGLNQSASEKERKKAYHALALKYHPDRWPLEKQQEMKEKFQAVNNANDVLKAWNATHAAAAEPPHSAPEYAPEEYESEEYESEESTESTLEKKLETACRDGNIKGIEDLIGKGATPTTRMLGEACGVVYGNEEVVNLLIQYGVTPDISMLEEALRHGSFTPSGYALLLTRGYIKPTIDLLDLAYQTRNPEIVNLLIEHGAVPTESLIKESIRSSSADVTHALIKNLAIEKNAQLYTNMLQEAFYRKNTKVIELLSQKGMKIPSQMLDDTCNHDPIDINVFNTLIKLGGKPSNHFLENLSLGSSGLTRSQLINITKILFTLNKTPTEKMLKNALLTENVIAIDVLIANGMKPTNGMLNQALSKYGENGEITQILFKSGAKGTAELLEEACASQNTAAVAFWIKKGVKPTDALLNQVVSGRLSDRVSDLLWEGITPTTELLNQACLGDNTRAVSRLIAKGAKPTDELLNQVLRGGRSESVSDLLLGAITPTTELLNQACLSGNTRAVRRLIARGAKPTDEMLERELKSSMNIFDLLIEDEPWFRDPRHKFTERNLSRMIDEKDITTAKILIEKGVLPTFTMLSKAYENQEMFQVLKSGVILALKAGNITESDVWEKNMVISRDNMKLVLELISSGVKPTTSMLEHLKIKMDDPFKMNMIVEAIFKASLVQTPQMLENAIKLGNVPAIRLLIEKGVYPSLDMLSRALEKGNAEVFNTMRDGVVLALAEGKIASDMDIPKNPILAWVCEHGSPENIHQLIQNGKLTNQKMMEHAISKNNINQVKTLLTNGTLPTQEMLVMACNQSTRADMAVARELIKHITPTDAVFNAFLKKGNEPLVHLLASKLIQNAVNTLTKDFDLKDSKIDTKKICDQMAPKIRINGLNDAVMLRSSIAVELKKIAADKTTDLGAFLHRKITILDTLGFKPQKFMDFKKQLKEMKHEKAPEKKLANEDLLSASPMRAPKQP